MQINLGDTQIVELIPNLSDGEIQERISDQRMDAFGIGARLMQRPKPSEITITRTQKRFEPFWYSQASAHYRYDRHRTHKINLTPNVEGVTVFDQPIEVTRDRNQAFFSVDALEHCVDETKRQIMLDAETGIERDFTRYLAFKTNPVANLEELQAGETVVVPPEVRSSYVLGKLLQLLMTTIPADEVHEERIDVELLGLYNHPIYAFECLWIPKDRHAVLEFDPLLLTFRAEGSQFKKQMAKVLANDVLFDIGADAIGTVLPGANIAIKLGRLAARKAVE
jgi:hypothetical protein